MLGGPMNGRYKRRGWWNFTVKKENGLALVSMTGFARAEDKDETYAWAWEVKSVNGKSLDTRTRVPAGFDRLELAARKMAGNRLRRGNVNLSLTIDTLAATSAYRINRDLLDQIIELKSGLSGVVADGPPTLEGLLAIRGMIESAEPEAADDNAASRDEKILKTLDDALVALSDMRDVEGGQLTIVVETLLTEIETISW